MSPSHEPATIYDLLTAMAPGRVMVELADGSARLTYGEVRERADALAGWLGERGVKPSDRIVIQVRKGFEEVICTFACARLGAVFINVHPQWKPSQLRYVLAHAGAQVAFVDPMLAADLVDEVDLVVSVGDRKPSSGASYADALAAGGQPPPAIQDPGALATLLYTSGSTGSPKGVMHSHRSLVQFATNVSAYLGNAEDDRVLGVLPLSFGYGLSQLLTMAKVGGTLVLERSPFAADIFVSLVDQRITGLAGVASFWAQMLGVLEESPRELPALRYITNAGGKLPVPLARRLHAAMPDTKLIVMYGSTESLRTTYVPPAESERKAGAIGWPIPGVEAFVITDDGRLAGPGEQGEIIHVGDHMMMGYWNDPEATQRKLRPCPALADRIGDEPALYTEDLARIDEDGCFWFLSRASWMVKSEGFRFSLTEVEEAVERTGLVGQAIAFASEDPDHGQVVDIIVTAGNSGAPDPVTLLRTLRRAVPRYMVPRKVHLWAGTLPHTVHGKLDRQAALRALGFVH